MQVKFVKTTDEVLPSSVPGESIIYEMKHPFNPDKPNCRFWLQCHKCGQKANLADHEVIIDKDSITISPSIQCPVCPAHYYIKNSKVE